MKTTYNHNSFDLPSDYKRKNIAEQIKQQRIIFDSIWKDSEEAGKQNLHLQNLINVMEDSIAIAHDLFKNDAILASKYDKFKLVLVKIWNAAKEFESEKKYSLSVSLYLHRILAISIEAFRGGVKVKKTTQYIGDKIRANEKNCEEIITEMIQNYEKYILTYNESAIFILHRHPNKNIKNSHIAPKTFVDQFFHPDYSANFILFDVVSRPASDKTKEGVSKQEPHWGILGGAIKMFDHDRAHCSNIDYYRLSSSNEKLGSYNLRKLLNPIYNIIKPLADKAGYENITTILYNGLFLLSHEIIPNPKFTDSTYKYITIHVEERNTICKLLAQRQSIKAIQLLIEGVESHVSKLFKDYIIDEGSYKFFMRDWEFVLKSGVDLENKPFLPMITIGENKKRPFPIGKSSKGYLVVEEANTDITYLLSSAEIPMELKMELMWERSLKMQKAVENGYKRFWETFSDILWQNKDIVTSSPSNTGTLL